MSLIIMHTCRLCGGNELKVVKKNEMKCWLLCKKCFYLQRTLEPDYEQMFIENLKYAWGILDPDWSEALFLEKIRNIGGEWDFFCSKIGINQPKRVLDFGAGTGPLLEYLKHNKIDGVGIELSQKNAAFIQSRGHQVYNKPITELSLDTKSYQIVHLQDSGTYIRDIYDTFAIFNEILEDSGYIFWQDKVYNASRYRANEHIVFDCGPAAAFSKASIKNLLGLTGFKVVYFENKFGHFRLIAQKTCEKIPLEGSYWKEYMHVKALPVLDRVMPTMHFMSRVKNKILSYLPT